MEKPMHHQAQTLQKLIEKKQEEVKESADIAVTFLAEVIIRLKERLVGFTGGQIHVNGTTPLETVTDVAGALALIKVSGNSVSFKINLRVGKLDLQSGATLHYDASDEAKPNAVSAYPYALQVNRSYLSAVNRGNNIDTVANHIMDHWEKQITQVTAKRNNFDILP